MKKYIFYVISSLLLFSSCSSQLDVTPPNAITDEQISELLASGDATTINKILGSMANAMPTQFNNSSVMTPRNRAEYICRGNSSERLLLRLCRAKKTPARLSRFEQLRAGR